MGATGEVPGATSAEEAIITVEDMGIKVGILAT